MPSSSTHDATNCTALRNAANRTHSPSLSCCEPHCPQRLYVRSACMLNSVPSVRNVVVAPGHVRVCLAGAGAHCGRRRRYSVLVGDASAHLGVLVVANVIRLPYRSGMFTTTTRFELSTSQACVLLKIRYEKQSDGTCDRKKGL